MKIKNLLVYTIIILLYSCSYKNLTYFKNVSNAEDAYRTGQNISLAPQIPLLVKVDDVLSVNVTTVDPQGKATMPINALSGLEYSTMSGGQSVAYNKSMLGYLVNKSGEIELPILGTVKVEGLTTSEATALIKEKASVYFKNPTVNVRLLNFRVTVLGEVTKPGTYSVDNERVSVLDAIGFAGDLTVYGRRENVMLLRETAGVKKAIRMNLNDANIISSPYFYLLQNDVVYVEPTKNRAVQSDAATTRNSSIIIGAAGVMAVILAAIIR